MKGFASLRLSFSIFVFLIRGSLKGEAPSKPILPLSFKGEGDKGGEVDKQFLYRA